MWAQSAGPGNAPPAAQAQAGGDADQGDQSPTRPQKLVLKDGTFQMVREYKIEGERVSYYSLDTHQWEEMPAALVDWDATKKLAADQAKKQAALASTVDEREKQQHAEVLSVDASIEPAPGVFLPPDVGLFAFDGKTITPVDQAEITSSLNKTKALEKVLVPIPIVPTRHTVTIAGSRAKLRLKIGQPEFYIRTADSREPDIDLVRVKVHTATREVENIDEVLGETSQKRQSVDVQRWKIADNVYRLTLAKPIDPGEYVLVETLPNQELSLYVWDFGVDHPKPQTH